MNVGQKYQGSLDGLCGMYAITNALSSVCKVGYHDLVFRVACDSLAQSRWPRVLTDGTTFSDMQRMIKSCLSILTIDYVKVEYPFLKRPPRSNAEYWDRFDQLHENDSVICTIMGLTEPNLHWVVGMGSGKRVEFIDSHPMVKYQRKNRSSLFAGERQKKPSQWLLNRKELILFSIIK